MKRRKALQKNKQKKPELEECKAPDLANWTQQIVTFKTKTHY